MNRRDFMRTIARLSGAALLSSVLGACSDQQGGPMGTATRDTTPDATPTALQEEMRMPESGTDLARATVAMVKPADRATGVERALGMLDGLDFSAKHVFIKPNFNSADNPPASTHNQTIRSLVRWLRANGAERISIGDRSGMGRTRDVMQTKGIFELAEELNLETIVFDDLGADQWETVHVQGSHWQDGFPFAKPVLDADAVVSVCCLKTHRYGGHFSMALKNSVGMVARTVPGAAHDYMLGELHASPNQRLMIAEINAAYTPQLILLDAMEGFSNQGPETGRLISPGVILAASDRIAIDAVGVSILRHFGTTDQVSQGSIFDLEQIRRAVELELGVANPEMIDLRTDDAASREFADQIWPILNAG
jgi:uncharacterized protein (DUF362 family)